MTTNARAASLALLHLIVFIWGFTGILGKEITLDAFSLVWWRVIIALGAIGLYATLFRKSLKTDWGELGRMAAVGVLTAAHWLCFFGSIKESNVSVALAVLSTTSFFVALVAPLIRKERLRGYQLLLGAVVVLGLSLIFRFETQYLLGILLSLAASFFAALFSSFNSTLVSRHPPVRIAFWEMLAALIFTSLFLLVKGDAGKVLLIDTRDLWLVLLLGVICTGFAFIAGIEVMKILSPFTCALTINLEPIYTIGFALWIYGESEYMSPQFYFGAMIILSTLFINAWFRRREFP